MRALALSLAALAAVAAPLGARAATTPAATAKLICARVQADVGRTAYLRVFPVSSSCKASMTSVAATANRVCLRKGKSGSARWKACVAVKVAAAARAEAQFIELQTPKTTTTTTMAAPAAQPPVTTQPGPIDSLGTISFLTPTALTVGVITCTLDASSPSLGAYKVGDRVDMLCQDGVVRRVAIPPP